MNNANDDTMNSSCDTITLGPIISGSSLDTFTITGHAGSPFYGSGTYSISPTITLTDVLSDNTLHVKGDAEIDGDLKIKGKSLNETLQSIEERLAILRINHELEEKWSNLKELGRMYRELEAEIIEKQKVWDILKK